MSQYSWNPSQSKQEIAQNGFLHGFMAARKLAAVAGRIAQLENADIQKRIMAVGTEDVKTPIIPPELSDIIIDTLN